MFELAILVCIAFCLFPAIEDWLDERARREEVDDIVKKMDRRLREERELLQRLHKERPR